MFSLRAAPLSLDLAQVTFVRKGTLTCEAWSRLCFSLILQVVAREQRIYQVGLRLRSLGHIAEQPQNIALEVGTQYGPRTQLHYIG